MAGPPIASWRRRRRSSRHAMRSAMAGQPSRIPGCGRSSAGTSIARSSRWRCCWRYSRRSPIRLGFRSMIRLRASRMGRFRPTSSISPICAGMRGATAKRRSRRSPPRQNGRDAGLRDTAARLLEAKNRYEQTQSPHPLAANLVVHAPDGKLPDSFLAQDWRVANDFNIPTCLRAAAAVKCDVFVKDVKGDGSPQIIIVQGANVTGFDRDAAGTWRLSARWLSHCRDTIEALRDGRLHCRRTGATALAGPRSRRSAAALHAAKHVHVRLPEILIRLARAVAVPARGHIVHSNSVDGLTFGSVSP